MIDEIWKTGSAPDGLTPPIPNQYGMVPVTQLVHHIDHLGNFFMSIPIDQEVAGFIQRKSPAFSDTNLKRELVTLNLLGHGNAVFQVHIWIIPFFQDGVMVTQIYAADSENQQLLLDHRNPASPGKDDYSIL